MANDEEMVFSPEDLAAIEHVGGTFAPYLKRVQPVFEGFVYTQGRSIEHILSLLENYYLFLSFIGDERVLNGEQRAVMGLAAKAATDVGAIYRIQKAGYPVQARTILRSLVETAITTRFIYLDFDHRIELFHEYQYFIRYHKMASSPELADQFNRPFLEAKYEKIKDWYKPNKDWYFKLLKQLRKENPEIPENPSIRALAIAAGMSEDYERMYGTLSLATHPSAVIDHVFQGKHEHFQMGPSFNRSFAATITPLTMHYGHVIFEQILDKISSAFAKELISYSKMLYIQAFRSCEVVIHDKIATLE